MIDPKRMTRIWSKCPELFPDFDGEPLERVISENGEYIARWLGSHELSDSVISALIRDKCVWWLAAHDTATCILCPGGRKGEMTWEANPEAIAISVHEGLSQIGAFVDRGSCPSDCTCYFEPEIQNPDPTEACLLAVERVLGMEPWDVTIYPSCIGKPPERSCPPRGR